MWVAFAPGWRLVVAFVVGKRTQEQANLLLDRVVYVTDDRVPFFTSDQWPGYPAALLHAYGEWYQPERQGKRGWPHASRAATISTSRRPWSVSGRSGCSAAGKA